MADYHSTITWHGSTEMGWGVGGWFLSRGLCAKHRWPKLLAQVPITGLNAFLMMLDSSIWTLWNDQGDSGKEVDLGPSSVRSDHFHRSSTCRALFGPHR